MDQSAVKTIVRRELPRLQAALGIPHYRLTVEVGPIPGDRGLAGQCTTKVRYNSATIELDPAQIEDETHLLKVLRHELFHVVLTPYDLFAETVGAPLDHESPESKRLIEVWRFCCEQAVINLERMWNGSSDYWRKQMSVKKVGKGYENVSKSGKKMSKKPISKKKAMAQLGAIEASKAAKAAKKK